MHDMKLCKGKNPLRVQGKLLNINMTEYGKFTDTVFKFYNSANILETAIDQILV